MRSSRFVSESLASACQPVYLVYGNGKNFALIKVHEGVNFEINDVSILVAGSIVCHTCRQRSAHECSVAD